MRKLLEMIVGFKVMDEEIHTIEKNNALDLTNLPSAMKSIGVKWVYKTKCKINGKVDHFKARLAAKGYKQKLGSNFFFSFFKYMHPLLDLTFFV